MIPLEKLLIDGNVSVKSRPWNSFVLNLLTLNLTSVRLYAIDILKSIGCVQCQVAVRKETVTVILALTRIRQDCKQRYFSPGQCCLLSNAVSQFLRVTICVLQRQCLLKMVRLGVTLALHIPIAPSMSNAPICGVIVLHRFFRHGIWVALAVNSQLRRNWWYLSCMLMRSFSKTLMYGRLRILFAPETCYPGCKVLHAGWRLSIYHHSSKNFWVALLSCMPVLSC
jgi:hypothetical protein